MPQPAGPQDDPRRALPAVHTVLADPALGPSLARHGRETVTAAVRAVLTTARTSGADGSSHGGPDPLAERVLERLSSRGRLRPVLNATGVVVHTGLGRAPLSRPALDAVADAAGATDVELSLDTGRRGPRGAAVLAALTDAVPAAEAAHVVNNGAAALLLAITALAPGREVVVSRGQLVEIGDGFRLPELLASTGSRLREVGTTNRTHVADYLAALGPATGVVLVVHPGNVAMTGFAGTPSAGDAAAAVHEALPGVPVVVDTGSGLLHPHPALPDEPDAQTALQSGADLVTCSGDKLLGGPQAGLLLGRADLVHRARRHALARALRVDKLTLAALGATLAAPGSVPVTRVLALTPAELRERCTALRDAVGSGEVVEHEGVVGGGGAPGVRLPGWALALPEPAVAALRTGVPPVLARAAGGRTLVDPRCVDPADLPALADAVHSALTPAPGAG